MLALTRDQLRTSAPSIFTRSAYHTLSPRYRVAPTAEVVDLLEGIGYFPVRAQQSRCRLPDKREYAKHLLRFRKVEHLHAAVATEVPEIVLTNSFDGSSAYRLDVGLYRICCLNGLVCPTEWMGGISVRHSGGDDFASRILDATHQVVERMPSALATVQEWKQLALPAPVQKAFAEAAHTLLDSPSVTPEQLLTPRRVEDAPAEDGTRSLWATYNAVEEHLLKGGIQGKSAKGRKTTTRPVKSVDRDVKLNKALWVLAAKLAETVK